MRIQPKIKNLEALRQIMQSDYGVTLSDDEADQFGLSLLKLHRLAAAALVRAEEKHLMVKTQL